MAYKLKNWKKTSTGYRHKTKIQNVHIIKYDLGIGRSLYKVEIIGDQGWMSEHKITTKDFKTKSQALKFAKEYMVKK